MDKAYSIGVSGMGAAEKGLDVTANDIANANTNGFQSQNVSFQDLMYQQIQAAASPSTASAGTDPIDIGSGTKVGSVSTNFTQGQINYTGVNTDAAIQGQGFFVVADPNGNNQMYTRDGEFEISKNGQLVTKDGKEVQGWNYDTKTGSINTGSALSAITIPSNMVTTPNQSTQMTLSGNLDSTAGSGNVYGFQVPTYDSLGALHNIDVNFIQTGAGQYRYVATPEKGFTTSNSISSATLVPSSAIASQIQKGTYTMTTSPGGTPGTVTITVTNPSGATVSSQTINDVDQTVNLKDGSGNTWFTVDYKSGSAGVGSPAKFTVADAANVTFNTQGSVQSITSGGVPYNPSLTFTPTTTGKSMTVSMNLSGLTDMATGTGSSIKMSSTNGNGSATLNSVSITNGGLLQANYSDGTVKQIGELALASFSNNEGLNRAGGGYYTASSDSGVPSIGTSGSGQDGKVEGASVESSNVNLPSEFTQLLSMERAYQGDAKIITTADTTLQSVLQLIQ